MGSHVHDVVVIIWKEWSLFIGEGFMSGRHCRTNAPAPGGRSRPCTCASSTILHCRLLKKPPRNIPRDVETSVALEDMMGDSSQTEAGDPMPARNGWGHQPLVGSPKLARASKQAWPSSVTKVITPSGKAPLQALWIRNTLGGRLTLASGMESRPGFFCRSQASSLGSWLH